MYGADHKATHQCLNNTYFICVRAAFLSVAGFDNLLKTSNFYHQFISKGKTLVQEVLALTR